MADTTSVVHIGENSPEEVALKLLRQIAQSEGKRLSGGTEAGDTDHIDRAWLLDTYSECLQAVKGYRSKPKA